VQFCHKQRLALGLEQANTCALKVNKKSEVIISCMHHPYNCFHECDKTSLNVIQRISDIILFGHLHEASFSQREEGNLGQTLFITAGTCYEKRLFENAFNEVEIDLNTLEGNVLFYKYMRNDHEWIINKDIKSSSNGVFSFKIERENTNMNSRTNGESKDDNKEIKQKYVLVLDASFDELNRDKVSAIVEHLKTVAQDTNVTIKKMEKSSVKIIFETTNEISTETMDKLKSIYGLNVVKFENIDSNNLAFSDFDEKTVNHWNANIDEDFTCEINNPGANYTHSRADQDICLADLFVAPNLKAIKSEENSEKIPRVFSADEVFTKKQNEQLKIVIYGDDSSGKSTLCKWYYKKLYDDGYVPILISGKDFKDVQLEKIIKNVQHEFFKQYQNVPFSDIKSIDDDRIILIIDDFHKVHFSESKYKANLLSNINRAFSNVIIVCHDIMKFEKYITKSGTAINIFEDYDRFSLIEFGPSLRYELIKKWNGLGSSLDINELIVINKETEAHINSIIGKNFVPSYPVFLLTILQAREATTIQKPEYSLHGFYYELLINESLNKAVSNKAEISLYYNYITDYAYFLFEERIRQSPIHIESFKLFHNKYCEDYRITVSYKDVLKTLYEAKLLKRKDDYISITYNYIYYFFIAKYLSNNISSKEIQIKISALCERVHRDEFSSIIMFLTHLSKDKFILDQILANSKKIFSDYKPIKLEEDILFINEMIKSLPEQIYEPIDVEQVKKEELAVEEELEIQEKEFDSEKNNLTYDIDEDISTLDVMSKLVKAVKTVEIVGQVTKKYWGELRAPQKYELAEETYLLGLRTLSFYYSILEQDKSLLIEYLKMIYKKSAKNKNLSKEEIEKASRNYLFGISVMASYGITKRVSNAIGYEKLSGIFEDVLKNHSYNSVKLIDTSIKLDYNIKFPWNDIKQLKNDTEKNYLARIVLQNLVISYLNVFKTTIEEKQRICAYFGIKMESLRFIEGTSEEKKQL
jgi:GTPase SAR1 family protein